MLLFSVPGGPLPKESHILAPAIAWETKGTKHLCSQPTLTAMAVVFR